MNPIALIEATVPPAAECWARWRGDPEVPPHDRDPASCANRRSASTSWPRSSAWAAISRIERGTFAAGVMTSGAHRSLPTC